MTRTIQKLDPGASVEVDLERHLVEVRSSRAPDELAAALAANGYPAVEAA